MVLGTSLDVLPAVGQHVLYVGTTGNDANDGTRQAPLATIVSAFARAQAGTQVLVLPGRYVGANRLRINKGEPEHPIVIRSMSRHPDSLAIIDGGGQPELEQLNICFLLAGVHWVTIQNLRFENCWTDAINIAGSSYITLAGNTFIGSRRAIQPTGGTHHVLVENNTYEQDERVWTTWAWDDLHHGEHERLGHFNGALFHPSGSEGGHVMRGNVIKNVFNGFRTRPDHLDQDANIEVYDNTFINVRDNAIEPEGYVWNHHYYRNRLFNSRKSFSIHDVRGGGAVYIWGNIQWQEAIPKLGPNTQNGSAQRISGLWKLRNSPLADTVWIFNNSFYTEADVFKDLELPFTNIQHINNAYSFFGSGEWGLRDWDASYRFNHDCTNETPPRLLQANGQAHQSVTTSALFVDPLNGNLRLVPSSPCRDAGHRLRLPMFGWTQTFTGAAPDIGSFEDSTWVEGPAFRYREPPGTDRYDERPRIVRHHVDGPHLSLFFSAPLNTATVDARALNLFLDATPVAIASLSLSDDGYILKAMTVRDLSRGDLALAFDPLPMGTNDQPATHWASTIPFAWDEAPPTARPTAQEAMPEIPAPTSLAVYPNPANANTAVAWTMPTSGRVRLDVYDLLGRRLASETRFYEAGEHVHPLDTRTYASGLHLIRLQAASLVMTQAFLIAR